MSKVILTPEQAIRQRYAWLEEAARVGNIRLACIRCGISRKSYYKWRRFQKARGRREVLLDRSRRRIGKALGRRLLALRRRTPWGPARLRAVGVRGLPSAVTFAKLLRQAGLTRRRRAKPKRSRRTVVVPRPGDLLQFDGKWGPYLVEGHQLYQHTAIDRCTRLRLLAFSDELSIAAPKAFAQFVLSTFPFPVRCVETDTVSTSISAEGREPAARGEIPQLRRPDLSQGAVSSSGFLR